MSLHSESVPEVDMASLQNLIGDRGCSSSGVNDDGDVDIGSSAGLLVVRYGKELGKAHTITALC